MGTELLVARSVEEAEELYQKLLVETETAAEFGRRARERILKEHTFHHRAREVVAALGMGG